MKGATRAPSDITPRAVAAGATGVSDATGFGFRLPKSTTRWMVAGLSMSSAVLIIISLSSGTSLSQLASAGLLPIGLALTTVLAKLPLQVVKFRVLSGGLSGSSKTDL